MFYIVVATTKDGDLIMSELTEEGYAFINNVPDDYENPNWGAWQPMTLEELSDYIDNKLDEAVGTDTEEK